MPHRVLRVVVIAGALLATTAPCGGQTPTPPAEPPLRRWFEIQNLIVYTRYRFTESSADIVGVNDLQYKESFRARFNADAKRRYTLNIGAFSGSNFIGSWNNTGLGINTHDLHSHYIKQLFGAAVPVNGLELQYGGLYTSKGETSDYAHYDDDGYIVGERVSVRRPDHVYLDEITVTRAMLGPPNTPNLFERGDGFTNPNYAQILIAKRFTPLVAGSLDYSTQSGADTIRAAVSLRFKATAPVNALRYEQYHRTSAHPASGFAVTAERPITKWVRLQAGYASIDEFYGGLNADRIQRGRRVFAVATSPTWNAFSVSFFVTEAFQSPYVVSNRTRFDAVLQYDVLARLRDTGRF